MVVGTNTWESWVTVTMSWSAKIVHRGSMLWARVRDVVIIHIELDFHDMYPRHASMSWTGVVEVKFNEEYMSWNYVVGNDSMSYTYVVEVF